MSGSVWITCVPVESEEKRGRTLGWAREQLRVWNEGSESQGGPGVRKGFEGGQMPLYRRIPLVERDSGSGAAFIVVLVSSDSSDIQVIRWTNGCMKFLSHIHASFQHSVQSQGGEGMHARLPKYVPLNLKDIADAGFKEGEEVSGILEDERSDKPIWKRQGTSSNGNEFYNSILGNGELRVKLNFKARAFSESAKEKLKTAGCSLTILPGQKKWVKPSGAENIARAEEYFAKKRASSESDDSPST